MTAEELYAMEAETGRTSEWEPLYRAEKRRADAAEAAVARVRALCDEREDDCGHELECHCDCVYATAVRRALDAP